MLHIRFLYMQELVRHDTNFHGYQSLFHHILYHKLCRLPLRYRLQFLLYAYKYIHTLHRLRLSTHALLLQPSLNYSSSTSFHVSLQSESIPLLLYACNYIGTRCKFHFPNCALLLQLLLDCSNSTSFYVSLLSEPIPLLLYACNYIGTRYKFHFSTRVKRIHLVLVVHLLQGMPHPYTDTNDMQR